MFLVAIAGGSGSGKTTFANRVKDLSSQDITLLHMDSYYLNQIPQKIYTTKGHPNFDHPEAFDWELLRTHIQELKNGHSIEMPIYDFKTNSRSRDTKKIDSSQIVIFEGIFTLHCYEIRKMLDIKCFLDVASDIRFTRRLHRDIKERARTMNNVIEQYYETVRPMYIEYLEPQKQYADFIIGEENGVAAEILAARLNLEIDKSQNKSHSIPVNKLGINNYV